MNADATLKLTPIKRSMHLGFLAWAALATVFFLYYASVPTFRSVGLWLLLTVVFSPVYALLVGMRSLRSTKVLGLTAPLEWFAHSTAPIEVSIEQTGRVAPPLELYWAPTGDRRTVGTGASFSVALPLEASSRGRFTWPALVLETMYPAGLLTIRRQLLVPGESIVFPAPEARAPAWPDGTGANPRLARQAQDVTALRDYRVGDPLRQMDWKASARRGDWVVREFEKPQAPAVVLAWKDVQALGLEKGVSRLTAWVLRADREGVEYALDLGKASGPFGKGSKHRRACLTELALFEGAA